MGGINPGESIFNPSEDKKKAQKEAQTYRTKGEYARVIEVSNQDWEALHGGKRKRPVKKKKRKSDKERLELLEKQGREALELLKSMKIGREEVRFAKPQGERVQVEVDLKKLDKHWVRETNRYVPPDCSDELGWRCWRFLIWLRKNPNIPVKLPQVHVFDSKSLDFADGRHRTRSFMLLGLKSIPVAVEPVDEKKIRSLVGTRPPPKRTLKEIVKQEKEKLALSGGINPGESILPDPTYQDFQIWLKKELQEFEKIPGQGRLIPIRKIRANVKNETIKENFDRWILKMERDFLVSLQTHNSPYMLSEKEKKDSIPHETRGLIYYVAGRPEWLGERTESGPMVDPEEKLKTKFEEDLKSVLIKYEARKRYGQLIPIHLVRKDIKISKKKFDSYLFELEKESKVSLQTYNSPSDLPEKERKGSIQHRNRGLVYYVMRKKSL